MLPHAKVAELIRIYGKGAACKVKLCELAIGVINRGISWKYVQTTVSYTHLTLPTNREV